MAISLSLFVFMWEKNFSVDILLRRRWLGGIDGVVQLLVVQWWRIVFSSRRDRAGLAMRWWAGTMTSTCAILLIQQLALHSCYIQRSWNEQGMYFYAWLLEHLSADPFLKFIDMIIFGVALTFAICAGKNDLDHHHPSAVSCTIVLYI